MTLAPPEKSMQPASAVAELDAVALADLTAVGNFRKIYTSAPAGGGVYLARAPGRVEILGNHTDYNDGFVLSAGVQMQCRVVGGIGHESTKVDRLRVYSAAFPDSGVAECSVADVLASSGGDSFRALKLPPYCVYVCGVIVEFSKQFGGKLNLLSHDQTSSSHDRDTSSPSEQAPRRPHPPDPNSTSLDLYIESEVPLGAAVSSSAALEVATAMLLQEMFVPDKQNRLPDLDLILLCKRAENNYVGMGCGILDQFSSHQAERDRLLVLDCRYPMENLVKLPMGVSSSTGSFVFVIANTGVKHALVDGQYDNLKRLCYEARDDLAAAIRGDAGGEGNGETDEGDEGGRKIVQHLRDVLVEQFERYKREIRSDEARNRGEHVVYENQRVQEACGKLLRLAAGESSSSGDRPEATATDVVEMNLATILGPRMTASHKSSRDLFGNSCPELDQMVALALEAPGCFGSRLMGGGFGGCTISLVEEAKVNEFSAELGAKYKSWFDEVVGGKDVGEGIPAIHVVRPGDGAFVKKLRPEELAEADRAAGGGGGAETCAVL